MVSIVRMPMLQPRASKQWDRPRTQELHNAGRGRSVHPLTLLRRPLVLSVGPVQPSHASRRVIITPSNRSRERPMGDLPECAPRWGQGRSLRCVISDAGGASPVSRSGTGV